MEFEWDPRKAAENYRKHGIRFEEAQEAFFDPNAVEIYDDKHSDVEADLCSLRFLLNDFCGLVLLFEGTTLSE
jgi:uncharacterized DUF497 family protein